MVQLLKRIRARLSYGNVTATLALFIALGGTGYAAIHLPRNSVGRAQLRSGAVTNAKIAAHAIRSSRIRANTLTGTQINERTLGKVPAAARADTATVATNATLATNASALAGKTAGQLTDHCPTATRLIAGSCLENTPRAATFWAEAESACSAAGRTLPTPADMEAYSYSGAAGPNELEWTADLIVTGPDSGTEAAVVLNPLFGISSQDTTDHSHAYQCEVAPSN